MSEQTLTINGKVAQVAKLQKVNPRLGIAVKQVFTLTLSNQEYKESLTLFSGMLENLKVKPGDSIQYQEIDNGKTLISFDGKAKLFYDLSANFPVIVKAPRERGAKGAETETPESVESLFA